MSETCESVAVNDVVQIDPAHDERFAGCLLVVTEVERWGVQGYVQMPKSPTAVQVFYRVRYDKLVRIGPATWAMEAADDVETTT